MTDTNSFPQAPSPTAALWEREMQAAAARKLERVNRLERSGAQRFNLPSTTIARERDGRTDAEVYVWRTTEGDVFVEVHEVSDVRHDAVVVDVINDYEYQTLRRIDPDEYASRAKRHREENERAEAERAAEQARIDEQRRASPRHAVMPHPSVWDVPTLVARVKATAGHLSVHEHRVLLTLPSGTHLIGAEGDYRNAVHTLRPLLDATNLGTVMVPCDVDGCEGDAITVAAGGAFLCAGHGR